MTTFGESSYSGNPYLWECPLPKNCSWPKFVPSPPPIYIYKIKRSTTSLWHVIRFGFSYGIAFGGVISLILIKINWRRTYFIKVDAILMFLFPWMKNLTLWRDTCTSHLNVSFFVLQSIYHNSKYWNTKIQKVLVYFKIKFHRLLYQL